MARLDRALRASTSARLAAFWAVALQRRQHAAGIETELLARANADTIVVQHDPML